MTIFHNLFFGCIFVSQNLKLMTEEQFFEIYKERLQNFVVLQKEDIESNPPKKLDHFIQRSDYLNQLIIDKSNVLISEIFIDFNLDFTERRILKGNSVNILQYFLLGISSLLIDSLKDFQTHSDTIRHNKFNL